MPRDVTVVFVHGIYNERINFADEMIARLKAKLRPLARDYVQFKQVSWKHCVHDAQRNYLDAAGTQAKLPDSDLRTFFVMGLGDAAAYQKTRGRNNSSYYRIQNCLCGTLREIASPGNKDRPLILVGHSLGCHIISSYAWDINWLKQRTAAEIEAETDLETKTLARELRDSLPVRRLDTFAGLVTMGSNMPLFTFTFGPDRVFPITHVRLGSAPGLTPAFPGRALSPGVREKAKWLNFYSKNDAMGFPLKPLNPFYRDEERLEDIPVRSESGLLSMLSSLQALISAHKGYWTNPTVITRTAGLIQDIIEAPA